MKVHVGVDKDSGLIHSVATRAANSSDVVMAPELLHGEEKVVYGDAGYQGLQKREEMEGKEVECRIAMRAGNRRRLPATAEGELLRWMERAKAHIRAKVEHPFRVIKEQFGFCRTRLRGMCKNHCKVTVLAALANLVLAKKRLLRLRACRSGVSRWGSAASIEDKSRPCGRSNPPFCPGKASISYRFLHILSCPFLQPGSPEVP